MSTDRPIPTLYGMIATPALNPRGAGFKQIVRSRVAFPTKDEAERRRKAHDLNRQAVAAAVKAGLVERGIPAGDAGRKIADWLVEKGLSATEAEAMRLDQVITMLKRHDSTTPIDDPKAKAEDIDSPLPPRDLAKIHDVDPEALRKRLERYRRKDLDSFVEVDDGERKPRQAKYLYHPKRVEHIIRSMKRA